jgi:hypothetical protein
MYVPHLVSAQKLKLHLSNSFEIYTHNQGSYKEDLTKFNFRLYHFFHSRVMLFFYFNIVYMLKLFCIVFFSLCYRSDKDSGAIYIYDGRGGNDPLQVLEKLHYKPVILIKVHIIYFIYFLFTLKRTPLEISGNASFMGHSWRNINLQVHFSLEVLVLFHIFKLLLYIVDIDS